MTLSQDGFYLTIQMRDSGENKTSRTFQMTATTFTDAETDAAAVLEGWNALTDAEIIGYTISARYVETAPVLPAAGIQIENTAEVVVNIEGSATKKASFNIPAPTTSPAPGVFLSATGVNSNVVNTSFTALTAFVANFASLGNNRLLISDGEHADGVNKGFRVHKKSRRG